MFIEVFIAIWSMLQRFSESAWSFLTLDVGVVFWDFVNSFMPPAILDLVRTAAFVGGHATPEAMLSSIFHGLTMLELFLGGGIVLVLGYKFVTWILDVFF